MGRKSRRKREGKREGKREERKEGKMNRRCRSLSHARTYESVSEGCYDVSLIHFIAKRLLSEQKE